MDGPNNGKETAPTTIPCCGSSLRYLTDQQIMHLTHSQLPSPTMPVPYDSYPEPLFSSTDISEKSFARQQRLPPKPVVAQPQANTGTFASSPQQPEVFVCTTVVESALPREDFERAYNFVTKGRSTHNFRRSQSAESTGTRTLLVRDLLADSLWTYAS